LKEHIHDINDELLVKYLVGEASREERAEVEQWIAASEANKKYFDQYRLIWEKSKELAARPVITETQAWERFKEYRTQRNQDVAKLIRMDTPQRSAWIRIAAILLLIAGGGLIYFLKESRSINKLTVYSKENVLTDTLPDGSVIVLNRQSALSYPEKFSGNSRTVELKGEAFFTVTPDKTKPFIIHTGDVGIKVVGTSFNVKNTAGKTEVIVETGIVEISKKQHPLQLRPKEMATVFSNQPEPVKQYSADELYQYYRTKAFVCNGTPLWKLVEVLNEAYGASIVIADSRLKDLRLTTTFRNERLEDILKVISATFNIQVEKKNGQFVLQKAGVY
jgi:ferric-dicitrate binding protein FerR (iron transport regulator)